MEEDQDEWRQDAPNERFPPMGRALTLILYCPIE